MKMTIEEFHKRTRKAIKQAHADQTSALEIPKSNDNG